MDYLHINLFFKLTIQYQRKKCMHFNFTDKILIYYPFQMALQFHKKSYCYLLFHENKGSSIN